MGQKSCRDRLTQEIPQPDHNDPAAANEDKDRKCLRRIIDLLSQLCHQCLIRHSDNDKIIVCLRYTHERTGYPKHILFTGRGSVFYLSEVSIRLHKKRIQDQLIKLVIVFLINRYQVAIIPRSNIFRQLKQFCSRTVPIYDPTILIQNQNCRTHIPKHTSGKIRIPAVVYRICFHTPVLCLSVRVYFAVPWDNTVILLSSPTVSSNKSLFSCTGEINSTVTFPGVSPCIS